MFAYFPLSPSLSCLPRLAKTDTISLKEQHHPLKHEFDKVAKMWNYIVISSTVAQKYFFLITLHCRRRKWKLEGNGQIGFECSNSGEMTCLPVPDYDRSVRHMLYQPHCAEALIQVTICGKSTVFLDWTKQLG